MSAANRISGLGNLVTAGASLYQNADLFRRTQALEEFQHEQELELMRTQHRSELITAKQTYLISAFTDLERYCQELNENLMNSSKDAERDMVDQRSQQFQTILIAGTIMITSVMNVFVQGQLPTESDEISKLAFAVSNTGSIVFIGINLLLCIQLVYRVSQFMYRRSESNLTNLSDAMNETKRMMANIRGETTDPPERNCRKDDEGPLPSELNDDDSDRIRFSKQPLQRQQSAKGKKGDNESTIRKRISTMTSDELDKQWEKHEAEIHAYLHRRSAINERRELARFGAVSFENYWNKYCRDTGYMALVSFYIGTSLTLIATMVYMWSIYLHKYNSFAGAIVGVITIGISLVVCIGFAVYLRFFDPSINDMRSDSIALNSETSERSLRSNSLAESELSKND